MAGDVSGGRGGVFGDKPGGHSRGGLGRRRGGRVQVGQRCGDGCGGGGKHALGQVAGAICRVEPQVQFEARQVDQPRVGYLGREAALQRGQHRVAAFTQQAAQREGGVGRGGPGLPVQAPDAVGQRGVHACYPASALEPAEALQVGDEHGLGAGAARFKGVEAGA